MSRKSVLRIILLLALLITVAWAIIHRDALTVAALQARSEAFGNWAASDLYLGLCHRYNVVFTRLRANAYERCSLRSVAGSGL